MSKTYFTVSNYDAVVNKKITDKINSPFVVISIVSPEMSEYKLSNNNSLMKDVLYLRFHDITERGINSMVEVGDEITRVDNTIANKILDFAEKNKNEENWLIHCEAGMSRSPAVALALSEIMNGGDDYENYVFTMYNKDFHNKFVKETILSAYKNKNNR